MIDLTPMGGVRVDPERRRAWVQGGALLGALDDAAQEHGLATTAGNVSHTGVGGLTLGGGMGWLARRFGLTCDNVEAFELVTADGDVLRVTESENDDLFWALRGGGGNFGVVTAFELRLHPIGTQALSADLYFALDDAPAVLRGWRDLSTTAPREATFTAGVGDREAGPTVAIGFVWVGAPAQGRALLEPLRDLGRPVAEQVRELSYLELQRMEDDVQGHAIRRYWKGHYFRELTDEVLDRFLLRGTADGTGELLPNGRLQAYGGAIADVPDSATAFGHRAAGFELIGANRWTDAAEDEARMAASRRYGRSMDPFAIGAYVNALSDEGAAGVARAYPPDKLARLTAVKDSYDPDNVFQLNANIRPSRLA
jgi:FAD/FMN-containing dehydrogenase